MASPARSNASSHSSSMDWANRFLADDLASLRAQQSGHVPPVSGRVGSGRFGFELKVHNVIENKRIDKLQEVEMPPQWTASPRFSTRTELRQNHRDRLRPSMTYDCDGDGFVGQKDFQIAKKHDLGAEGMLSGGQRDSAIAETCYRMGSALHDDEIGGNAKARRVLTSLREKPELSDDTVREQRMRVGQMCVSTLKNKSSHQLKECMTFPEAHVPEPGAPVYTYTRTMLLAQRRVEREQTEKDNHKRYMATTIFHPEP